MSRFAANLATLPPVDRLRAIRLVGPGGEEAQIENCPGSQGSLRIHAWLLAEHGSLDRIAAEAGLALYAEHVDVARAHPGTHPNIDRLLAIVADGRAWRGWVEA